MRRAFRLGSAWTAAAIVVALGCKKETIEQVDSEIVVAVKTVQAARGDVRRELHATGQVSPAPGAELVVVAPEPARVAEVPKAEGERVVRGDVLVRFEIPSSVAEVQRQQAEIVRTEALLDHAKAAQGRSRDLFDRGIVARRDVEDATRSVADAEAALAQARVALAAAQALAGRATVLAPFDGVVAKRFHNSGDLVESTASDPVLRVVDPSRLEVVAAVPLADALRIEEGRSARVVGAPFETAGVRMKVLARPFVVEPGAATVQVRLGFVGSVVFPVGTPVQVDVDAEQHTNVVTVPLAAVVREGQETAVFVVTGDKAQRRPVRLGLSDRAQVEVIAGVNAGDLGIVDGQAGLPDDATVKVEAGAGAGAGKDEPR